MKPTKVFKMWKTNKMLLSSITDKQLRSEWKRMLIEAQLIAESSERAVMK